MGCCCCCGCGCGAGSFSFFFFTNGIQLLMLPDEDFSLM